MFDRFLLNFLSVFDALEDLEIPPPDLLDLIFSTKLCSLDTTFFLPLAEFFLDVYTEFDLEL